MSFRLWALALASLSVCSLALASDHKYVREEDRAGRRHFTEYKEFGNRRRIAKRLDPSVLDTTKFVVHERDQEDGDFLALIPKYGNRNRISRYVDASVADLSGKALVVTEPYGHRRLILMPVFGNRYRLEKLLGQY
jgi:hypothetical protein